MATASVRSSRTGDGSPSPRSGRRILLWVAGAVLGFAVAILVTLLFVSTASDGAAAVLVGTLDSNGLAGLSSIAGLAALSVGLCAIPVGRRALLLLVPARIAGIAGTALAGVVWLLTASATVVPLIADGCDTGYVVKEESFLLVGSGTVYRQDGLLVAAVARTSGDDGYHPFADGAYSVTASGASLDVWYSHDLDPFAAPVTTDRDPDLTLPILTGRTPACGLATGARTPIPATPTAPAYSANEARAALDSMVAASLDAAVGPVLDSAGQLLERRELAPVATACGEDGSRTGLAFTFKTADNAASLARILQIWDAEGYDADRAMQEDIRYSSSLPVERMSIRDSTTIDGLIHMQVTSRCGVG